jgi:hypothetical protein
MKHIKIYEEYKDEVPASMRDLFSLTSKIIFWDQYEWRYVMEGPIEYEEQAQQLADRISDLIEGQYDIWDEKDEDGSTSLSFDEHLEEFMEKGIPEEQEALSKIGWMIYQTDNEELY